MDTESPYEKFTKRYGTYKISAFGEYPPELREKLLYLLLFTVHRRIGGCRTREVSFSGILDFISQLFIGTHLMARDKFQGLVQEFWQAIKPFDKEVSTQSLSVTLIQACNLRNDARNNSADTKSVSPNTMFKLGIVTLDEIEFSENQQQQQSCENNDSNGPSLSKISEDLIKNRFLQSTVFSEPSQLHGDFTFEVEDYLNAFLVIDAWAPGQTQSDFLGRCIVPLRTFSLSQATRSFALSKRSETDIDPTGVISLELKLKTEHVSQGYLDLRNTRIFNTRDRSLVYQAIAYYSYLEEILIRYELSDLSTQSEFLLSQIRKTYGIPNHVGMLSRLFSLIRFSLSNRVKNTVVYEVLLACKSLVTNYSERNSIIQTSDTNRIIGAASSSFENILYLDLDESNMLLNPQHVAVINPSITKINNSLDHKDEGANREKLDWDCFKRSNDEPSLPYEFHIAALISLYIMYFNLIASFKQKNFKNKVLSDDIKFSVLNMKMIRSLVCAHYPKMDIAEDIRAAIHCKLTKKFNRYLFSAKEQPSVLLLYKELLHKVNESLEQIFVPVTSPPSASDTYINKVDPFKQIITDYDLYRDQVLFYYKQVYLDLQKNGAIKELLEVVAQHDNLDQETCFLSFYEALDTFLRHVSRVKDQNPGLNLQYKLLSEVQVLETWFSNLEVFQDKSKPTHQMNPALLN